MARPTKSIATVRKNLTKAEIQARTEAEAQVAAMTPPKKPRATIPLNPEEKKLFNKFVKLNNSFTEADSTTLSLLVSSLYRYQQIKEAIATLDIFDEQNITLERRALAYDKAINQHMTALCLPLSQRFRLANDMAKVMIEEKKLEQMNNQPTPQVNPLLALLLDDDE